MPIPFDPYADYSSYLRHPVFELVERVADTLDLETYVVGGWVRDLFLERHSNDIDIVCVGSGITLARAVAQEIGPRCQVHVFANFGTAQLRYKGVEVEFVGARRESYQRIVASRLSRMARSKMIRSGETSPSMRWLSRSTNAPMASS